MNIQDQLTKLQTAVETADAIIATLRSGIAANGYPATLGAVEQALWNLSHAVKTQSAQLEIKQTQAVEDANWEGSHEQLTLNPFPEEPALAPWEAYDTSAPEGCPTCCEVGCYGH